MNRGAGLHADLALVLVSLFWGVTFPLIRSALADVAPTPFLAWRFGLATAAFLPLALLEPRARAGLRRAVVPGAVLGLIAWASYVTQTIGLQTVPAGRAAFITGTSVILVPLLSPLFRAGRPGAADLGAAAVAAAGLFLLTRDGSEAGAGFGTGDLWVAGCALSYSVYLLVLPRVIRPEHDSTAVAFTQVAAIGVVTGSVLAARGGVAIETSAEVLRALLFCALVATVGTFWLQTRYQPRTTPQRAALIFALEPVFATVFGWWMLNEGLNASGMVGAGLILAAVVGSEVFAGRPAQATGGQEEPTPVDS